MRQLASREVAFHTAHCFYATPCYQDRQLARLKATPRHNLQSDMRITTLFLITSLCLGCATPGNQMADGTPPSWWRHLGKAVVKSVSQPKVWAPIVGATVLSVDDWDQQVSDWAVEHTPIFGSNRNALQWSDDLLRATRAGMYASILAVPGWMPSENSAGKIRTLLVDAAGSWSNDEMTQLLKHGVGRERPDGTNRRSFPSGHASNAFAHSGFAAHNLAFVDDGWARGADYTMTAMAMGASWARIEGQKHYPGDILAGAALGTLISDVLIDLFLEGERSGTMEFTITAEEQMALLHFRINLF